MDVADKAVATDELRYVPNEHSTCLEVARLEAVLNTLVEQKADEIKSTTSRCRFIRAVSAASPKTIAKRLRIASLSTSIPRREAAATQRKRRRHRLRHASNPSDGFHRNSDVVNCSRHHKVLQPPPSTDEIYLQYDPAGSCCCIDHSGSPDIRIPVGCEDYVSLKIDECDDFEEDDYEAERRRRKRRKRRRKRRKLRAMAAVAIVEEVRAIDPDELPPKARWTILITAGILLFMCLMLVGVTLRMAPLIDDMVRKENEALLHALHGNLSLPPAADGKPPTL